MKKLTLFLLAAAVLILTTSTVFAKGDTPKRPKENVAWHLSGAVMPVPPYGSQDIIGSDTASKLTVKQPKDEKPLSIKGKMKGLAPNTTYTVYLSKAYTPYVFTGWNVTGNWVIDFEWKGGHYPNDVVLSQDGNTISGTIGWPSGSNPYSVTGTVNGTINNNGSISLTVQYNDRSYLRTMTGTIDSNGQLSGSWNDANAPTNDNGTWASTSGQATKNYTGDTGWPGLFTEAVQPFTFTTNDKGDGKWKIKLNNGDYTGQQFSVWINNQNGLTILISDNVTIKPDTSKPPKPDKGPKK